MTSTSIVVLCLYFFVVLVVEVNGFSFPTTKIILSSTDDNAGDFSQPPSKRSHCEQMPLSQRWYKNKQQHISPNQKKQLRALWPKYGIDLSYGIKLSPQQMFNMSSSRYTILDIGFGSGESIVHSAAPSDFPKYVIGCEIHRASISSTLQRVNESGLENVRIIRADVQMLLEDHLVEKCLDEVCVYFPDPWPNSNRDGQRRVIRPNILRMLEACLKPGGSLKIATDVESYATHVRLTIQDQNSRSSGRQWLLVSETVSQNLLDCEFRKRPLTKYEKRGYEMGHFVWDFEYKLIDERV